MIENVFNFYKYISAPVGTLKLVADSDSLLAVLWEHENPKRVPLGLIQEHNKHPILVEAEAQLDQYFNQTLQKFNLPLRFKGTDFQKEVWHALLNIPYGTTCSYAHIAQGIKHPLAVRAVGTAIGKNPLSIIAPCHRVIGSNGALTGFAGGLTIKAHLLNLENKAHSFRA